MMQCSILQWNAFWQKVPWRRKLFDWNLKANHVYKKNNNNLQILRWYRGKWKRMDWNRELEMKNQYKMLYEEVPGSLWWGIGATRGRSAGNSRLGSNGGSRNQAMSYVFLQKSQRSTTACLRADREWHIAYFDNSCGGLVTNMKPSEDK